MVKCVLLLVFVLEKAWIPSPIGNNGLWLGAPYSGAHRIGLLTQCTWNLGGWGFFRAFQSQNTDSISRDHLSNLKPDIQVAEQFWYFQWPSFHPRGCHSSPITPMLLPGAICQPGWVIIPVSEKYIWFQGLLFHSEGYHSRAKIVYLVPVAINPLWGLTFYSQSSLSGPRDPQCKSILHFHCIFWVLKCISIEPIQVSWHVCLLLCTMSIPAAPIVLNGNLMIWLTTSLLVQLIWLLLLWH